MALDDEIHRLPDGSINYKAELNHIRYLLGSFGYPCYDLLCADPRCLIARRVRKAFINPKPKEVQDAAH